MSDDKDMRDLMDRDFEEIEAKLQNGHSADPATQGRALALLLRHVRVLVRRNTVTEDECKSRMAACPGVKLFSHPKETLVAELVRHGFASLGWLFLAGLLAWKAFGV